MSLGEKQAFEKRQRTLFASMFLSLWAPLATGIAFVLGGSITQFADFVRRTVEFLALVLSWAVFRYLGQEKGLSINTKKKWEAIVNRGIAIALGVSGLVMLALAFLGMQTYQEGGNLIPGLVIGIMGFIVNFWFWRRYRYLAKEKPSPIIYAQGQLYLAKLFVDICIILTLTTVYLMPSHSITEYIDTLGSTGVALYLLWSSYWNWRVKEI